MADRLGAGAEHARQPPVGYPFPPSRRARQAPDTMTFLAEQYSGFFRRSVAALQSRPEADALERVLGFFDEHLRPEARPGKAP